LNVSVVPNGVDTKAYRPYPLQGRKKDILMVGTMDHKPNVDAAKYFYNEIFPHIRAKVEEVTLTVVGKNPPSEIQQLDSDSAVEIRPNVPDVRPYYKKAMVSAVPLRSGGGTRLKILESMALGTPVVSTSVGCEGLEVKNKHNILIANNPVDFANKVIGLLTSATLWTEISQNGRDLVEKKYDWRRLAMVLERVYDEALSPS
jgi:glycosyltransferase involved in cell wall biosynthesis